MAEALAERGLSLPRFRIWAVEWLLGHAEVVALASIMAVAAALRLWDLDAKAFHHDESLHATFSWYLYDGRGYRHDPLMHGPFQFQVNALFLFLFGATDFVARLPHALFGTALVGMPYLLRRQIGVKAVLISAVLLTFSPTLLYFSRFDREDIYAAFWTLALVICLWRYLDERRPLWLAGMAASLALGFATKELTYITVAVVLLFLDLALAFELGKRRDGEAISAPAVALRSLILAPLAWLIAVAWPLLGRRPFGHARLPPYGDALVVLGTLTLPQLAAAIQKVPLLGVEDRGYDVAAEDDLRMATVFALLVAAAYVGLLWRAKLWLVAAVAFYVPYVLLFTTFLTNQPFPWESAFWHAKGGFFSGIWGSLDYWLPQQHVRRGNQPGYYYALMTPLYEFLPLLLGLAGAWWVARRNALSRWLLFWLGGVFVGLTLAGEKMPWLEAHIALPLSLIGAVALAAAVDALGFRERGHWLAAGAAAAVAVAAVLLLLEADGTPQVAGALLGAALLGWVLGSLLNGGVPSFGRAAVAVAVAALFTLTVRAGLTAAFKNDDTPVEMLVYTQTSPDIPQLVARIDALARESGLGANLPIVVDNTDGYSWPWAWYLRDYHSVSYVKVSDDYKPPDGAVLLVHAGNAGRVDAAAYSQTAYRHRWWFCESYRDVEGSCTTTGGLTLSQMLAKLTNLDSLSSLADFFLHRRPADASTIGSVDAVAFFPQSLAAFDVEPPPPLEPRTLADGRIVIGRAGSNRGELNQPADVFVDGQGNIWVADGLNHRVQKFDASGRYVGGLGRGGTSPADFNEPWSVAVDAEGFVYVADTWHHRIQKFSPALDFVASWGGPATRPNPGPLELFGPRDIVVAEDGTLWVTDTGNERLIHYSKTGEPLDLYGREGSGAGEFLEPVGLAYDAAGNLFVADTWNGRIQRFAPTFASSTSFQTSWTSREVIAKPYLAVLADGRLLASDPASGLLQLFDAAGAPAGSWRPEADALPVGLAALADGGFVFSDARRDEVQIVPAALISRLFR